MPAYVIVEIEVRDHQRYEAYKKISGSSVETYGGRFIVRGGKVETLEGEWSPQRFVIIEFPSADRAKEWWNSPEYAPGKKLRHETASTRMIVVQGI
jgi:uncharacterized protein (DUF1330 family)